MTSQDTDPDLPISVQESQGRCGLVVACCRAGGTECSTVCKGLLKEVAVIFITSTIVWPQVKQLGGNIVLRISRKWD